MKKKLFLLFSPVACFLSSCEKDTPLHHLIHETDVVRVYIYSGDQLTVKYFTNDIDQIKKWDNYIADDSAAAAANCNFEGRLVFKVYEDSTEMKFSLRPGCHVVSYSLNGNSYSKSLTPEGIAYLESLKRIE